MATSVSERNLLNVIKSHYSNVVSQKRFDWLGSQSLDIYIPSKKVAIEYQGEQHYQPVSIFGGSLGFRKQKLLDKKKKRLCKEHGISLYYFTFNESAPAYLHNKLLYKDTIQLINNIKFPWLQKFKYFANGILIAFIVIYLLTLFL